MVSINNAAGNSAVLASLRQINRDITTNQTRIGTGFKINSYSDSPTLYATAQSIRSDIKGQDKLSADIGIAKARADTAAAGLEKITDILSKIKEVADEATTNGATGSALNIAVGKIASYQKQLTAAADAGGFQSTNLLKSAVAVDVQLTSDTDAKLTFTPQDITVAGTAFGLVVAGDNTSLADVTAMSGLADNALEYIATYQAKVATFSEGLGSQLDFQTTLKGINETALSSIVDANLEEESAKSTALQVKQQLAYQALSIGNSSSQNILRLYQ